MLTDEPSTSFTSQTAGRQGRGMVDQSASSKDRLQGALQDLPVAHKVAIGASLAVVALAGVLFFNWISSPSYSVLAADITDSQLSEITLELDSLGVPYKLEAAGDRVMVPRGDLSAAKAGLAAAGITSSADGAGREGYELLDSQGLAISTNLERINFQRALEGELARTLRGMDRVAEATVHLALPDSSLFGDPGQAEASIIIDVPADFTLAETDAVSNLVAGAVENLESDSVTIIDIQGRTLQSPAGADEAGALGGRNVLRTLDFEQRMEGDITRLLLSAGAGDRASVMVRAELSYDEIAERTESFDQDTQIPIREQVSTETFSGPGSAAPGGVAGVDGETGADAEAGDSAIDYSKQENTTEYGVDSVVTNIVRAPGDIESLHIGIVVDDGSLTGATVANADTLAELITAGVGLQAERGDTLVVTAVPFQPVEALPEGATSNLLPAAEAEAANPLDLVPQAVGAVVLLAVAIVLVLMARKTTATPAAATAALPVAAPAPIAGAGTAAGNTPSDISNNPIELEPAARADVLDLVQRQPEDIATLLRGWLTQ